MEQLALTAYDDKLKRLEYMLSNERERPQSMRGRRTRQLVDSSSGSSSSVVAEVVTLVDTAGPHSISPVVVDSEPPQPAPPPKSSRLGDVGQFDALLNDVQRSIQSFSAKSGGESTLLGGVEACFELGPGMTRVHALALQDTRSPVSVCVSASVGSVEAFAAFDHPSPSEAVSAWRSGPVVDGRPASGELRCPHSAACLYVAVRAKGAAEYAVAALNGSPIPLTSGRAIKDGVAGGKGRVYCLKVPSARSPVLIALERDGGGRRGAAAACTLYASRLARIPGPATAAVQIGEEEEAGRLGGEEKEGAGGAVFITVAAGPADAFYSLRASVQPREAPRGDPAAGRAGFSLRGMFAQVREATIGAFRRTPRDPAPEAPPALPQPPGLPQPPASPAPAPPAQRPAGGLQPVSGRMRPAVVPALGPATGLAGMVPSAPELSGSDQEAPSSSRRAGRLGMLPPLAGRTDSPAPSAAGSTASAPAAMRGAASSDTDGEAAGGRSVSFRGRRAQLLAPDEAPEAPAPAPAAAAPDEGGRRGSVEADGRRGSVASRLGSARRPSAGPSAALEFLSARERRQSVSQDGRRKSLAAAAADAAAPRRPSVAAGALSEGGEGSGGTSVRGNRRGSVAADISAAIAAARAQARQQALEEPAAPAEGPGLLGGMQVGSSGAPAPPRPSTAAASGAHSARFRRKSLSAEEAARQGITGAELAAVKVREMREREKNRGKEASVSRKDLEQFMSARRGSLVRPAVSDEWRPHS